MANTQGRMTLKEMYDAFPNQWIFITHPELSDNTELVSGIVSVFSDSRKEIIEVSRKYNGDAAIRYTGDMPEKIVFIL